MYENQGRERPLQPPERRLTEEELEWEYLVVHSTRRTTMSDVYGFWDICYTDPETPEVEHVMEQMSCASREDAEKTVKAWQKSTWVQGRKFFCRETQRPADDSTEAQV